MSPSLEDADGGTSRSIDLESEFAGPSHGFWSPLVPHITIPGVSVRTLFSFDC